MNRALDDHLLCFFLIRRVHITEETLGHLDGKYQVEEGNGESRDPLLQGRKTYLVIDPTKPLSSSRRARLVKLHTVFVKLFGSAVFGFVCKL